MNAAAGGIDHRAVLAQIPPAERAALTRTSDGAGLRHLALHLAVIAGLGTWIVTGAPLWWLAIWPQGLALAFLFTLQHEATHRTPFRSLWLNELVGHGAGLILVQPFLWFRAFHMAHHRHTGDPAQDPELASPKPRTWPELLWHLATLEYWRDKLTVLLQNAAGTPSGAYSSKRLRPRITWEARAYLAAYAALGAVGLLTPVGAMLVWAWLLPLAAGFPVLRLYLLAEHDGCPPVADMFRNTRTTFTDALTRRLAWNMPYHAEHHAWPMVPFHKLPDLHRHTRAHLKSTSPSYRAFTGALAKRL